jgi:hypothetical protein
MGRGVRFCATTSSLRCSIKPLFAETEHDGCIVKDADGKVKKLVLFVYHPEGSMHCDSVRAVE